jgi:ABC-type dipeptide/oligopeptide/nickel transport system ATPase component
VAEPLLEVKDLKVHFHTDDGVVKAVDGVSYAIAPGETLGIVGSRVGQEREFPDRHGSHGFAPGGDLRRGDLPGQDLLKLPPEEMRTIRGDKISMIFQDPMTSLHPFYKVGDQIAEAILRIQNVSKKEAFQGAVDMLAKVNIPRPEERAKQFPHEFSGGMRQRAMIAMALALNPDLLIADEPTTGARCDGAGADPRPDRPAEGRVQRRGHHHHHDLGVVAEHCDNIQVMYAGKAVEFGNTDDIYYNPHHPYTWGLLSSIPRLDDELDRLVPIRGCRHR